MLQIFLMLKWKASNCVCRMNGAWHWHRIAHPKGTRLNFLDNFGHMIKQRLLYLTCKKLSFNIDTCIFEEWFAKNDMAYTLLYCTLICLTDSVLFKFSCAFFILHFITLPSYFIFCTCFWKWHCQDMHV